MIPFKTLTSIAAPLRLINVDTDMIIPKQFLRTIKRTGLAAGLFYEMRFDTQGQMNPDFVLNKAPYTKSTILIAGENFGCGSSREHAPWALLDFGIRCIIAPSYSDIFFNNCFKNGILPIVLPQTQVDELMNKADDKMAITIDLDQQRIMAGNTVYDFNIDSFRKHCLMNGLDEIGLTLEKTGFIQSFEEKMAKERPWI
ncbi:MAG: 3-isopropylmalate dehydratase small subunit [Pseudomonadota bacterium]